VKTEWLVKCLGLNHTRDVSAKRDSSCANYSPTTRLPLRCRPNAWPAICLPSQSFYWNGDSESSGGHYSGGIDSRDLVVLSLLDLSAVVDTVDHETPLHSLKKSYGLGGRGWFQSYLSGSISVCPLRRVVIDYDQAGMRRPTGFDSWTDSISSVRRRPASTGSCIRLEPPPLRRRHIDLRFLSAWWQLPDLKSCFWLCK